ncbi:hypothetical protein QBC47DRAFT_184000 [Echria macrotheca]|uniref:Uncharacterized protein n=1 Tax=Echria macrotheca TaxID=438768 RepID=A0AAJ0BDG3_9PEZI|nr:hypothetical protein QBC47DRAFT_184000 [Echria macrotheca]
MAPVTRSATLGRNNGRLVDLPSPGLFNRAITTTPTPASCGASFLFPTPGLVLHHLDSVNVTFRSSSPRVTLLCLCGEAGRVSEKFRVDHATPTGSEFVVLNFSSADRCWFHLKSESGECGDSSPPFRLLSGDRPGSARATLELRAIDEAGTTSSAATPPSSALLNVRTPTAAVAPQPPPGGDLSVGAKAGLGIGITLFCIAASAMAAFLYFRRRKNRHKSNHTEAIMDHERRHGRKNGMTRSGAESVTSGHSDEPLCPIQPVFDGFPGSTGYDDIRSLHSLDPVSPSAGHSPNTSHATTYWTDRDELSAARQKSGPIPIVTSYGPNPVTPTLTPRPSSRADLGSRSCNISTDSREGIPPMPHVPIPMMPDYASYVLPVPPIPDPSPSPPRKAAQPIVVSYGPNRVTPTPAVTTPTVPPADNLFKRHQDVDPTAFSQSRERRFSWILDDEMIEPSMTASAMGPLPPYASTADFYAMEKGAIRKLAEPQAEAELPPTKDGFYNYGAHVVEHELPGTAAQNEPQLPYQSQQYKRNHPEAGPSGAGGRREIDEQKFLLSSELLSMRAQKAKKRSEDEDVEEYDLGERR